jgi:hypothetical protein
LRSILSISIVYPAILSISGILYGKCSNLSIELRLERQ